MANKIKRELYSFNIDLEEEVEKEITTEKKKKNKETGKMETIHETVKKKVKVKTPVRVVLKKPTRTQIEDGDMFYSIWLNKFIKMGLLTRAMLAKKQVDVGGTLNEDDKLNYARLYLKLFEKQQNIIRYSAKDAKDMSDDEKERLDNAVSELAIIRKQLADFEAAQASIFDHTADVKARNKTITWFLLHLAHYIKGEGEDEEEEEALAMFPGLDFDARYSAYQEADENQDELFIQTIDRLSTVATIWYMSGVQEQSEFEALIDQINKDNAAADLIPQEIQEAAAEAEAAEKAEGDSEEASQEQKVEEAIAVEASEPQAPKKKRGRPKKQKANEE